MDFKRLKYFLAVAEELNIGRAATRLDMAQPPLSRQIAALEDELGVQLFDRARSQIRLTQAGEVLQGHARQLLDRLEVALRETKQIGSGAAGRISIGFAGSASYGVLPALIRSYHEQFPGVSLDLMAMNNADLQRALVQREIDVAVARSRLNDEELRSEFLCSEPLVLALPATTPLATQDQIALASLAQETLVLYPRCPRPSFADTVLEALAQEGLLPDSVELAHNLQSALSLISVGVGVGLVPQSVSEVGVPGVVFRPYRGFNPGAQLTAYARRDNRAPQVIQFFDVTRKFVRNASCDAAQNVSASS